MRSSKAVNARYYQKHKGRIRKLAQRRRRENIAQAILTDTTQADRRKGRDNDLDLSSIETMIAKPCEYCGETSLRMTLDRIDNGIGHVATNVVPACERCNYARRDMPSRAWAVVAIAMRKAREDGLFGAWNGGIHRRYNSIEVPSLPTRELPAHGTLARYMKCGPPTCKECKVAMRDWQRENRRRKREANAE